jgi:hypothetical protein
VQLFILKLLPLSISNVWPVNTTGISFDLPTTSSIPSQLSFLIRNVDFHADFIEFERVIKDRYSDVKNKIRLKSKFSSFCDLIKLKSSTVKSRKQLLGAKKRKSNHLLYYVTEFSAPINVLICSKCCGIGHFRE